MYAVIKTGGKQYKVAAGDVVRVEHLKGDEATFTPVLVVDDKGGTLVGAKDLQDHLVTAKVLGDEKGDKIKVFKYRSKSGYAIKTGHRQLYSKIEISGIGPKDVK